MNLGEAKGKSQRMDKAQRSFNAQLRPLRLLKRKEGSLLQRTSVNCFKDEACVIHRTRDLELHEHLEDMGYNVLILQTRKLSLGEAKRLL